MVNCTDYFDWQTNMIPFYIKLQYTLLGRKLKQLGVNPILGIILFTFAFILFSLLIFYKTELAVYIYTGFAAFFILSINTTDRIEFLKLICGKALWKIRMIENVAIGLPFAVFLLCKMEYIFAGGVLIFATAISFLPKLKLHLFRLPTPYFHRPFEFIIGFRKYVLLIVFALFLLLMAYKSGNMNLGLFSIIIHFGVILSYIGFVEPSNYINIYNETSKGFIFEKIKTTILYTCLSIIPLAIIQLVLFPESIIPLIFIIVIGLLILIYFVIGKYSNFPEVMSVPDTILFIASIFIPLLLVYSIPLFWKKSQQKIKHLLR